MFNLWIKIEDKDHHGFLYADSFDTKEECIKEYKYLKTIDNSIVDYDIEYKANNAIFSDDIQ
jgi:hypothetical protein